jgi:hypothetical protein
VQQRSDVTSALPSLVSFKFPVGRVCLTMGWGLLVISVAIFCFLQFFSLQHPRVGAVDYLQYWSASQLFANGGNPYDIAQLTALEVKAWDSNLRGDLGLPVVMYNPPLVFSFIFFLQWFSFESFRAWWCLGIFFFVVASTAMLFHRNIVQVQSRAHLYALVAVLLSFPPFYALAFYGQLSHLLLLSFCGCIFFGLSRVEHFCGSLLAGLALSVSLVKPHILWFVYALLAIQSLRQKQCKTIVGFALGTCFWLLAPLLVSPDLLVQYWHFLDTPPVLWRTATVGSWVQHFSNSYELWIKLLPTVAFACCAALAFSRRWLSTSSRDSLMILFPLSLAFAPYGWVYDQIVLLPLELWFISHCRKAAVFGGAAAMVTLHVADFFVTLKWGQESGILLPFGLGVYMYRMLRTVPSCEMSTPFVTS